MTFIAAGQSPQATEKASDSFENPDCGLFCLIGLIGMSVVFLTGWITYNPILRANRQRNNSAGNRLVIDLS
jgi:hypothetical protein